ncbi:MAG: UbiD family decarboxylase, partial [Chloroflexota bacterium]
MIDSLRDFLDAVHKLGDAKVIENADWDLEIGALTEWAGNNPQAPLLLFDNIKGYPQGFRVASNLFTSERRTAVALGLPPELRGVELVRALRERLRGGIKPIPPVEVQKGPIQENIMKGDEVDLLKFPSPRWHELDGGRYIGTGSMLITRDLEEGWVNLGTYRHQVLDKDTLGVFIAPGHHGDVMARRYWAKGKACPAVVVCGQDPNVWNAATQLLPWGMGEYEYAGGFKGKPVEVVRGITTDLPIPATAEIAIEGEIPPPEVETRVEGPFGEAAGYYGPALPRPVMRVKSVMYRDNPIIQGNPALISFAGLAVGLHLYKSAQLWDELDRQLPGVKGVWLIHETTPRGLMVISLKQEYPGHAKQAALVAAGCLPTAYGFKYLVVVDDDIDPSNITEVLWAIVTRTEPERSIDIVRDCWG